MTRAQPSRQPDAGSDPLERRLQAQRLVQIANVLCVVLLLIGAQTMIAGSWLNTGLVAAALALVLVGRRLNRRGRVELSVALVLCSLTVLVSASLWFSQGLYSAAVLGFPAILIVAGMVASLRLFVGLLLSILAVVAFLTYAALSGLQSFEPLPLGIGRMVNVSCILLTCAAAVWLLANDLRKTLLRLQQEILRVKDSEASFTHLAQHDALTNLPNRLLIRDRMEQAIGRARRDDEQVALLFLDLDNFKTINDSLGHAAGDELLQEVARRLKDTVRDIDTVSRQGGDEFLMVLADVADLAAVSSVAALVQQKLAQPFALKGMQIVTSISIGISLFPGDGDDFDTLLKHADLAMYQAKSAGRNGFCFFDEQMNADTHERLALELDLRQALRRDEFVLHYQPIVDLHGGRLLAAEALLRWQHPQRGTLGPDRFIRVAEQSGLIVEIGEWVLGEACRQAMLWQAAGLPRFAVSVNLSAVQFRRGNLEVMVRAALDRFGLAPACLELELTESILLQDSAQLRRLKELGVKLSIDDFGTGYSSLSYLQRFQVDKLKIDQSFVRGLTGNAQDQAIVTAIVQMARSLGLHTTAEGIEDEATRALLAELGCDQGQGYLFARPLAAAELGAFARRQQVAV
ncbi:MULTISPECIES: EAL domain-containing protein [unclassified Pseudomonas]|uniref:putative bifunctional diguanylate cyclase/phosphodiesterase n=1 Tax=unclassified Pseudomonas TaxID=196821 RepID=UPI00244C0BF3|nr:MULTISPECIES: EAL domain-containing protein [unclassified Pseudomonas]MDG9923604.1 EAL domain-containing protein [Pseudomonas sp. GD04045]MDH0036366.1 EAL domain-containing protein [Pseudomonas sp. GD04019]